MKQKTEIKYQKDIVYPFEIDVSMTVTIDDQRDLEIFRLISNYIHYNMGDGFEKIKDFMFKYDIEIPYGSIRDAVKDYLDRQEL